MATTSINIKTPDVIASKMIAPCGMNCAICIGYLREKKPCPGCLGSDINKPNHCIECSIKNCQHLDLSGNKKYCFTCDEFPCKRMKQLDKRYSNKYGMSMIENLENIRELGIREFVKNEKLRWSCQKCGGIICVHRENCIFCGLLRN